MWGASSGLVNGACDFLGKFHGKVLLVKDKGKVAPVLFLTKHHAMKAYWGSGSIVPLVL
jgi:hypothetical protein